MKIVTKPYLAHNEKQIQFFAVACPKIEGTFYCEETEQVATHNSTCIGAIFVNRTAKCHLESTEITTTIQQPNKNIIILINVPKILIEFNCSTPQNQTVEGTIVIRYNKCSIKINGFTYSDKQEQFWDSVHLLIPIKTSIQAKSVSTFINLPKLQEFDYKYKASVIELQNNSIRETWTFGTIVCILFITMIATAICMKKQKFIKYAVNPSPNIAPGPTNSLWPSLYSLGGGVMPTQQQQH